MVDNVRTGTVTPAIQSSAPGPDPAPAGRPEPPSAGQRQHFTSSAPRRPKEDTLHPRTAVLRAPLRGQGPQRPPAGGPGRGAWAGEASAHHGGSQDKTPLRDPDLAKSARHDPNEAAYIQQRGGPSPREREDAAGRRHLAPRDDRTLQPPRSEAPVRGAPALPVPQRPATDEALQEPALPPALAAVLKPVPARPSEAIELQPLSQWNSLRRVLAALQADFAACGVPAGFDALLEVLARTPPLCDLGAQATAPAREGAAALLQAWAQDLRAAVAEGRDGSELAGLYGHDDRLDEAIDALRTAAATRMLQAYAAPQLEQTGTSAASQARALVKREKALALGKLEVLRRLTGQPGYIPALHEVRISPALVRGLDRAHPAASAQAGILLGALLADEQALAGSSEARYMLQAVQARLQDEPAAGERAWLARRAAALQQLPAAGTPEPPAGQRLQGPDTPAAAPPALLQDLVARGLTGFGELQDALGGAGRVLDQVRHHRGPLQALGAAYQLTVDIERGRVLASGLLAALTGQAGTPPAAADAVRAALSGPCRFAMADGRGRGAPEEPGTTLSTLAGQYRELAEAGDRAQGEHLAGLLDTLGQRLAGDASQPLAGIDSAGPAARRERMASVLAARREAMGTQAARALQQALQAAALLTRPEALQVPDGQAGLLHRLVQETRRLAQAAQTGLLARDRVALHRAAIEQQLRAWGLDVAAIAPELDDLLSHPLDTARLDSWFATFEPAPPLQPQWQADLAALAERLQPGGARHLASASLERFVQALDRLEPGTRLAWDLDTQVEVSTPLADGSIVGLAGVTVQLGAGTQADHQVQAARDESGYELVLRSGRGAKGSLGLTAALASLWSGLLDLRALAGFEAARCRLDGMALRFPGTEAGRDDMKQLLLRLMEDGRIQAADLKAATQVLPVVVRQDGASAQAGARLDLRVPLGSRAAPGAGAADTLDAAPRLEARLVADGTSKRTTATNRGQRVQEDERSFSLRVVAPATPRVHATGGAGSDTAPGLRELLPQAGLSLTLPLPGATPTLVDFRCTESFRKVLEADRVAETTQRCVRIAGPAAGLTQAADQLGGGPLRAVAAWLRSSGDPGHHALLQALADVFNGVTANDHLRIVWRIDPQVQARADAWLREARALSAGAAGHTGMAAGRERARGLQAQVDALLADPASYRLHAVERVAGEHSTGKLGGLLDGSNVSLGYVRWGRSAQGTHERRAVSVSFGPELLRAALGEPAPQAARQGEQP